MRIICLAILITSLAVEVSAQGEATAGNASLLGSILQTFAALGIVLGLILLFYYAGNRFLKGALPSCNTQRYIRIIETRFLAPKKSLLLVEVGGEYLLLSSSGDGLQFIKQVDMLEEIEVIDSPDLGRRVKENLQNKIIDLVARLPKKNNAVDMAKTAGGKAS